MSNNISSTYNALLTAKTVLPRTVANRLPLLVQPQDEIVYEGFDRHDFPRFGGDIQYSIGQGAQLKCIGWSYGKYKGDSFVKTRNPFGKIHYIFEGELIDNSTLKPHKNQEEEASDNARMIIPFNDDLDDSERLCRGELELPEDEVFRSELNYPDAEDIARRDLLREEIVSFSASRTPAGNDTHKTYEYTGTYEDDSGVYKTVNARIAIDEEVLIERVLKVDKHSDVSVDHKPQINYYWTLVRHNQEEKTNTSFISLTQTRKAA